MHIVHIGRRIPPNQPSWGAGACIGYNPRVMTDSAASPARRNPLVLFLSTGRCGTQWLATNLADVYADLADVTHEPIGPAYRCREFFRAPGRLAEMAAVPEIAAHLDAVDATLARTTYIETGWPLFSAIPLFAQRFGEQLRIVHLTRHPVPTAISHMVHKTYAGSPRVDGYTQLAALDPFCPGVFHPDAAADWPELTPYEKTLFWWTEVHRYAEELQQRHPEIPFHRVRAEDVLRGDPDALGQLCAFMGLPWRPELARRTTQRVDEWHHRTDSDFDWSKVLDHPETVRTARRLGYEVDGVDERALAARYKE